MPLQGHRVDELLLKLNGWHRRGHELTKIYRAKTHTDAARLAGRFASEVEGATHEPTVGVTVDGARLYVEMHTPDEGGITDADIDLAQRLDIVARSGEDVLSPFSS